MTTSYYKSQCFSADMHKKVETTLIFYDTIC